MKFFAPKEILPRLALATLAGVLLLLAGPVGAQSGKPRHERTFDHAAGSTSASYHLRLREGETVDIKFTNTATGCFDYGVEKVERLTPESGVTTTKGDPQKTVTIVHEAKYGGYVVTATRTSDEGECGTGGVEKLPDVTIVIVAETEGIEVAFTGGFTFSDLTNPVFATGEKDGKQIVIRDTQAEDEVSLSVGTFIHVYGKNWSRWAPALSFGLGIGEESTTTYYLGPSWRIGSQAFLTTGIMAGSVDRPPAGVNVGDELMDANALNNLGKKTDTGVFLAFSYSFLGGGKAAFEKPFKAPDSNQGGGGGSSASATQPPPPPAAPQECSTTTTAPTFDKPAKESQVSTAALEFSGKAGCKPPTSGGFTVAIEVIKDGDNVAFNSIVAGLKTDGSFTAKGKVYEAGEYTASTTVLDASSQAVGKKKDYSFKIKQ